MQLLLAAAAAAGGGRRWRQVGLTLRGATASRWWLRHLPLNLLPQAGGPAQAAREAPEPQCSSARCAAHRVNQKNLPQCRRSTGHQPGPQTGHLPLPATPCKPQCVPPARIALPMASLACTERPENGPGYSRSAHARPPPLPAPPAVRWPKGREAEVQQGSFDQPSCHCRLLHQCCSRTMPKPLGIAGHAPGTAHQPRRPAVTASLAWPSDVLLLLFWQPFHQTVCVVLYRPARFNGSCSA